MRVRFGWMVPVLVVAGVAARDAAGQVAAPAAPTVAAASDKFLRAGQVTIRYRDLGRGDPVVMIHGYSRSLEDWIGLGDSLALTNRVIALDVRGFGRSTKFADPARYGAPMADDVIRLMDTLRLPRAHFVGHSMGALIAANLGVRYPARTLSLSLVAGPFFPDSASFGTLVAPWLADMQQGRGLVRFLRWLFPEIDSATAASFSAQAMAQNDSASMVAVLSSTGRLVTPLSRPAAAPTVILVGTGDPLLPQSQDLARRWPAARLVELAGADHVTLLGHPETLAAVRGVVRRR